MPKTLSRPVLACTLACASLLAFAGSAAAAPKVELRRYAFEVTGIQVIDWQYRSPSCAVETSPCDEGSGTQTTGWTTKRPIVVDAQVTTGRIPGLELPPLQLLGPRAVPRIRATVERKGRSTHTDPRPACEGSSHDESCLFVPLPQTVAGACGRRTVKGMTVALIQPGTDASILDVESTAPFARLFADCAPDSGPVAPVYSLDYPLHMRLEGAARRLKAMRRGRRIKLHREEQVDCPLAPSPQTGYGRCVTTDVTVEVTRRR